MRDTCICRGSMIHAGYIHDTCKINQGYMRDKCICSGSRYMRDTCGILPRYILGYVYLKCILRGSTYLRCRIHAGYMRDTCICKDNNQETCGIHPRYMMRYMYLKFVPSRIQTRPQVELEIRFLEGIPMYPTCIVSKRCRGGTNLEIPDSTPTRGVTMGVTRVSDAHDYVERLCTHIASLYVHADERRGRGRINVRTFC